MKTRRKIAFTCLLVMFIWLFPLTGFAFQNNLVADAPTSIPAESSFRPSYFTQLSQLRERVAGQKSSVALRHIVVRGESLSMIAKKYGITVNSLIKTNNIANRNVIHVGQVLALVADGGVAEDAAASFLHKLQRGETVWMIAKRYNVDAEQILTANNISDPRNLEEGRELTIPRASLPVTVSAIRLLASRSSVTRTETRNRPDFLWPATGYISSGFGPRLDKFHYGLDIAAKHGNPVTAIFSGKVVAAGWLGSYGYMVRIDHQNGWESVYGHNSKLYVEAGDKVEKGQTIAAIGQTGNATGPHVHLEIIFNEEHQNPLKYLPSQ